MDNKLNKVRALAEKWTKDAIADGFSGSEPANELFDVLDALDAEPVASSAQPAQAQVVPEGWREAVKAWDVCASIHREYAKGKDALFTTRQEDFVRHAANARKALSAAPALPQQGEKDGQHCNLCSGINGHHESARCPAYNSNQPEQLCQLSDEEILSKVPMVLCADANKTESRYRQGFIDFARSLLSSGQQEHSEWNAAIEAAAEVCMRATPNRGMVLALGEAAHYATCADAVRAMLKSQKDAAISQKENGNV